MIINFIRPSSIIKNKILDDIKVLEDNAKDVEEYHNLFLQYFKYLENSNYELYKIVIALGVVNFYYSYNYTEILEEDEELYKIFYNIIEDNNSIDQLMFYLEENNELCKESLYAFVEDDDISLSFDENNIEVNKNYNPFFKIEKMIIELEKGKTLKITTEEVLVEYYLSYITEDDDKDVAIYECEEYLVQLSKKQKVMCFNTMESVIEKYYYYQKRMWILNHEGLDDIDIKILENIEKNSGNVVATIKFIEQSEYLLERLLLGYFTFVTEMGIDDFEKISKVDPNKKYIKKLDDKKKD